MSRFDAVFGHRSNWTFNPIRRLVKGGNEPKQETAGNSPASEPNQRETPEQDKSGYKRVAKKYKCVTEPFYDTLRLLDEIL